MRNGDHLPLRSEERSKRCRRCGRALPARHFLGDETCVDCWIRSRSECDEDEAERVVAALSERAQVGLALGNSRNIAYPVGLDYHFTRLLDSLRYWVVRVRITLAAERPRESEAGVVVEGHLRRDASGDELDWGYEQPPSALALFRNPDDRVALRHLYYWEGTTANDFARIARIEIIDPLLLGPHDPVVIYEASDEQQAAWTAKRDRSLASERRKAKSCLAHAVLVLVAMLISFVPALRAWADGDQWTAFGWAAGAFVVTMIASATLIVWEGTDLTVLWQSSAKARL